MFSKLQISERAGGRFPQCQELHNILHTLIEANDFLERSLTSNDSTNKHIDRQVRGLMTGA